MPITTAIILAAGSGTRIWPYNEVRNKCAIPIANVPNVRRLADSLAEIGIQQIVIALGPQPGSIRAALRGCPASLHYVTSPADSGTAGALREALKAVDDERFLVLYGDTVTTADNLRSVAEAPEKHDSQGAILTDEMPHGESVSWYGAEVDNGRLTKVIGHGRDSTRRACGVLALDRSIIPYLESNPGIMKTVQVGAMPPLEPDLLQSLNDWNAEVTAVPAADFVIDLDKPWHILEANARMVEYLAARLTKNRIHPTARIHDSAEIDGFVHLGPNSEIRSRVVIKGSLIAGSGTKMTNGAILGGQNVIGDNTRISDYCQVDERTVIGSNCVVGHGAEMSGVLLDGAYLYHYCEISGVVGESVDIGAATVCGTLRFDDGDTPHRIKGRRESPSRGSNATYFGDYSRTGVNVITMPGVKLGPYSCAGPGLIVYQDLPARTVTLVKQETDSRPWGPEKYGW
jgi:bifunctional UDP-N-acetylglucosamine pyrophosphorylase/glucosamine-1-phosphate N-acetyltransferase